MHSLNKKIILLILSIMVVVAILIGSTYATFVKTNITGEQSYATGILEITSETTNNSVTLSNSIPIEDSEGKLLTPYTFKITNTGNLIYKFDVKLLSTTTQNQINPQYIKVMVNNNEPVTLNTITEGKILSKVSLKPGASIEVSLRVWLSSNTQNTEIGKNFTAKITTEGYAISNEGAILVTEEYLNQNTVITTENINLEYTTPGMTELSLGVGTYKLEAWGAQGGSYNSTYVGGLGGYSYGTLTLTEQTPIYVYVGGQPETNTNDEAIVEGGFNGGGNGANRYWDDTYTYAQGGGGASDIRIGLDDLYARVIVAGGGSGSTNRTSGYYGGGTTSGTGLSGYQATQTAPGTNGKFGIGGSAPSDGTNYKYGSAGGGGGWYGGGASDEYDDNNIYDTYTGGGSGYVYTSSTALHYPSGCLLNSSYYLTDAQTVGNGSTSFTDFNGTSVTGHSGNGAIKISGSGEVNSYKIPRLLGLTDLTTYGNKYDLLSDVTLECETGRSDCLIIGTDITDTSILPLGNYTIYYTVEGSDGKKYLYPRNLTVEDVSVLSKPQQTLVKLDLFDDYKGEMTSFSGTSESDGTLGVYSAPDDLGTSYYFRGAVTNNYVKFGKHGEAYRGSGGSSSDYFVEYPTLSECENDEGYHYNCTSIKGEDMYWRIIRINGDGTIRMIYDGTSPHENGVSSADRRVTKVEFNEPDNSNGYVGYMFGNTLGSTYALEHSNDNNSNVKAYLEDVWYTSSILGTNYEQYIADGIFCNDRRLDTSNSSYTGIGTTKSYYTANQRLYTNAEVTPILTCANQNDRFTLNPTIGIIPGNDKLKYPVGLITADEVTFAGAYAGGNSTVSNNSFYLYIGYLFYTLTPNYYVSSANTVVVRNNGALNGVMASDVGYGMGIRPVINIKADALMYGDGTIGNEFRVSE